MKQFGRILVRMLWLLLLLPVALVILGMAHLMLAGTMEESLNPALRYLASKRIVQVAADAPVNPGLDGRVVEVLSAPVNGCEELTDPDFGVSCRSAFLRRYFRRVDDRERDGISEPLSKYHHQGIRHSESCRVGGFRVTGQNMDSLLLGDSLDFPGTQESQKLRLPQDLQSCYVEGTYPPRFRLSDGGEAELCYLCQPEGSRTSFLGTQRGDALVYDAEAAALLFCRQWYSCPSELWLLLGRVAFCVAGTLPFFWAAVFLVQFALCRATGGHHLFNVPLYIPSLLLWLGMVCSFAAESLHGGARPRCLEVTYVLGYALGILCVLVFLALIFLRRSRRSTEAAECPENAGR